MAGVISLVGDSTVLVSGVQAVVLGTTAALVTRLTWRLTADVRVAAVAGLLAAVYGPMVCIDSMIFAEGLLIALLMAAMLVPFEVTHGLLRASATGVVLGLAIVVRPTAVALLPLLLWLLYHCDGARTRWREIAAMLASVVIVISPVLWKNWRDTGTPMIQAHFGLNTYLGNSTAGDGLASARLAGGYQLLDSEASRAGATPAAADRYYLRKLAAEWQDNPRAGVQVLLNKTMWFFQGEEIRDSHSYWFLREQSSILGVLPTFGWVLPFSMLGVIASVRAGRRTVLMISVGYIVCMGLTAILLTMGLRYRLPVAPMLCVLAAVGIVELVSPPRRHWQHYGMPLAVILVCIVLTNVRTHAASHNFAEEWAFEGMALSSERKPVEARAAFSRALAADQSNGLARRGLGLLAFNEHDWPAAKEEFGRATAVDPADSFSLRFLGLACEEMGDLEGAIRHLRAALAYRPEDVVIMLDLARVLGRAGAYGEAADVLERASVLSPEDPLVRVRFAGTLMLAGRREAAASQAQLAKGEANDPRVACTKTIVQLLSDAGGPAASSLVQCQRTAGHTPSVRLLSGLTALSTGDPANGYAELRALAAEEPGYSAVVSQLTEPRGEAQRAQAVHRVLAQALAEVLFGK